MEDSEVSARLSALPSPDMPADVTAAIEERLAQEHKVVPLTRGHTRRLNWLVAAAAVLGFFALVGTASSGSAPAPVAQDPPVVRAGAVFDPADFASQLQNRMTLAPGATTTRTFADNPQMRQACATAVQAYGRMMAIDAGTYDQAAAVVIVTSYPANTDYEEVWVVAPTCGQGDSVVYRHMIFDVDGSVKKV